MRGATFLAVAVLLTAGPAASARNVARLDTLSSPLGPHARVISDFNGDGFEDLAIGVPGEDVNGQADAGGVNVVYGAPGGLSTVGNQFWTLDSPGVIGTAEAGDTFGSVLAHGDFNGDGFGDLAIGVPRKVVSGKTAAGAASVLYGSSAGLSSVDQYWNQDSPQIGGESEPGDLFGSALAAGDFDGDGFDDLGIGSYGEGIGPVKGVGAVNVLYGFSGGLGRSNNQFWAQDVPGVLDQGETSDGFGYSLAAGDFNANGFDDLAIGVPFEDVGAITDAGAVNVLYGGTGGLAIGGNQFWTQDSPGVMDTAEPDDNVGFSLATGDFNGNGFDDLAIGVPFEDLSAIDAGAANLLYGAAAGLTTGGNQFWSQDSPGIAEAGEAGDAFAMRLASGDFNGDGDDDLALGTPEETLGNTINTGVVNVIYGGSSGLTSFGNQLWAQDSPGIQGNSENNDLFGFGLGAGDFDGNGQQDLAIGVPNDDIGVVSIAGAVNTLYGSPAGLIASGNQFWAQDVPGILDTGEYGDAFGSALA